MLWTIFVILIVLWLLGFSFHIAGGLIHLLLVIAVIVLIFNLIAGRRTGGGAAENLRVRRRSQRADCAETYD